MYDFWRGRKVFLTGQTGFKGAWLAYWLSEMGAHISGIALEPHTRPNLYSILGIADRGNFVTANINNKDVLTTALEEEKPEIVIHMAAQALVRKSYITPIDTFTTNVIGTVSLLDSIRESTTVKAVVIVTSDKVYENKETLRGYSETDQLGGYDPYSASKGCTEVATNAMRRSFFGKDKHPARIATVRAGNVIGGGDWSEDRLVPDIIRGCLSDKGLVTLRSPNALRPWQHVLDPLSAYLKIAELLYKTERGYDEAWNIGPDDAETHPVVDVATALVTALGKGKIEISSDRDTLHEANVLVLDCAKANSRLGWRPVSEFDSTISMTAEWYRAWIAGNNMADFTTSQIKLFEHSAKDKTVGLVNDK